MKSLFEMLAAYNGWANERLYAAVAKLCAELTATETCFPTTDLRLIYRQVGSD